MQYVLKGGASLSALLWYAHVDGFFTDIERDGLNRLDCTIFKKYEVYISQNTLGHRSLR